jgi:hypothetical protein
MSNEPTVGKASSLQEKWMTWTGRVLSAIPVLGLLTSATFVLAHALQIVESMKKFGFSEDKLFLIAILEIVSALVYAFPRTAVLGAILMTGYFGGAVATHIRVGDPGYPTAIVLGIFVWGGLYLRDPRLRALLPLRQPS